jgi:hypothetical protein
MSLTRRYISWTTDSHPLTAETQQGPALPESFGLTARIQSRLRP